MDLSLFIPVALGGDDRVGLFQFQQIFLGSGELQAAGLHKLCRQIVQAQVLRQIEVHIVVGPEHVGGYITPGLLGGVVGIQLSAGELQDGSAHIVVGLMVAEEEYYSLFIGVGEIFYKLLKVLVRLPHKSDIFTDGTVVFQALDTDIGVKVLGGTVIASVVHHAYSKEEEGLVALLVNLFHLFVHLTVGYPQAESFRIFGKGLFEIGLLKAQQRVDPVSVPGTAPEGVGAHGPVTQSVELSGQAGDGGSDILLISYDALGHKAHGQAGKKLKFGVWSVAPQHRHMSPAFGGIFLQGLYKGEEGLAGLEIPKHPQVGVGLVHDDDDVGPLIPRAGYRV